jgi:hypothetical protein
VTHQSIAPASCPPVPGWDKHGSCHPDMKTEMRPFGRAYGATPDTGVKSADAGTRNERGPAGFPARPFSS